MQQITLRQLIQYYDREDEPADRLQIVTDQEWDSADELAADSALLVPFLDWTVADLRCEKSFSGGEPVIRVSIRKISASCE